MNTTFSCAICMRHTENKMRKSNTQSRRHWKVNRIFEFLNASKLTRKKTNIFFRSMHTPQSKRWIIEHWTLNTSYTIFHFHLMPPMFPFDSLLSVSFVRTNCIESSVCLFQCMCICNSIIWTHLSLTALHIVSDTVRFFSTFEAILLLVLLLLL